MNKPNITPGPWKSHLGRGASPRFHIQTEAGYHVASTTELSKHAQAADENSMRQANAKAIAALPAILEALESSLDYLAILNSAFNADKQREQFSKAKAALTAAGYEF